MCGRADAHVCAPHPPTHAPPKHPPKHPPKLAKGTEKRTHTNPTRVRAQTCWWATATAPRRPHGDGPTHRKNTPKRSQNTHKIAYKSDACAQTCSGGRRRRLSQLLMTRPQKCAPHPPAHQNKTTKHVRAQTCALHPPTRAPTHKKHKKMRARRHAGGRRRRLAAAVAPRR
jgi:hypothetical protein